MIRAVIIIYHVTCVCSASINSYGSVSYISLPPIEDGVSDVTPNWDLQWDALVLCGIFVTDAGVE